MASRVSWRNTTRISCSGTRRASRVPASVRHAQLRLELRWHDDDRGLGTFPDDLDDAVVDVEVAPTEAMQFSRA